MVVRTSRGGRGKREAETTKAPRNLFGRRRRARLWRRQRRLPQQQGTGEDSAARTEFFHEATIALKSLKLARATLDALQALDDDGVVHGRALVDSSATTSMRTVGHK